MCLLPLAFCLLAAPGPVRAGMGVRAVEIRISAPGSALFPSGEGGQELALPVFDSFSPGSPGAADPAASPQSLSLPPSAIAQSQTPAMALRADENGFLHLAPEQPRTAGEPSPLAALDPPAAEPRNLNQLGVNASLDGRTRLTAETPSEEDARVGGPLHQQLARLQQRTDQVLALAQKADWDPASMEKVFGQGGALWEGGKARSDPADLGALEPLGAALIRYGMTEKQAALLIARYAQWHAQDEPGAFHTGLLGVRAANLMAQLLESERITNDGETKLALVLAALLHRTAPRRVGPAPTAEEAMDFIRGDHNLATILNGLGRPSSGPTMYERVRALAAVTDYAPVPGYRKSPRDEVAEMFGRGQPGLPADQRAYGLRLASALQFATRAALFTDTIAAAEQAVRARAREAGSEPSVAFLAAAAELETLRRGVMPAGGRDAYISLPDGPASRNLMANYRHFKELAAGIINERAFPGAYRLAAPQEPAKPGPHADALAAFDRTLLEAVEDRELNTAGKSVFLGAAVLGYPLEDSLWLARTRIENALEENDLHYPPGQRWTNDDGTPEFLGRSARAKDMVRFWGGAVEYARAVIEQIGYGFRTLPKSPDITPEAAAAFARLISELYSKGDSEAVNYLEKEDPTFVAFLLDARKPGYFLYNGEAGAVGRILQTEAAAQMGLRRLDHPQPLGTPHVYVLRPARVVERLRGLVREESRGEPRLRPRLVSYLDRLAPAAATAAAAPAPLAPYTFVEPQYLRGSVLASAPNQRASYGEAPGEPARLDLAFPVQGLRGRRFPELGEARARAMRMLIDALPDRAWIPGSSEEVRLIASQGPGGPRLISSLNSGGRRGVTVQVLLLDEIVRLDREPSRLYPFLRFVSAALDAALP